MGSTWTPEQMLRNYFKNTGWRLNKLPIDIKSACSISSFKAHFKTHYFQHTSWLVTWPRASGSACARSINGYCRSGQIIIRRIQIHSQFGNVIFELYLYSVRLQVSCTLTRNLLIHLPIIRVTTFTENICSSQGHASTPQLALSHF